MIKIAQNLRTLRLKSNKKQDELAELLGISQQEYSKFERNGSTPNIKHLGVLAKYYNVTVDQLLYADLSEGVLNPQMGSQTLSTKERDLYERLLNEKDAHIKTLEAMSTLKLPKDNP